MGGATLRLEGTVVKENPHFPPFQVVWLFLTGSGELGQIPAFAELGMVQLKRGMKGSGEEWGCECEARGRFLGNRGKSGEWVGPLERLEGSTVVGHGEG